MGVWHRSLSRFFSPDEPHAAEPQVDQESNLHLEKPISEPLLKAISTNDLPTLRALLETQDRQLFSQIAQNGTPEAAAYLLSRHTVPEDYSQYIGSADPILHPTQYLIRESARYGNAPLFRYLLTQYPAIFSSQRWNNESILLSAMQGGVGIWRVILDYYPAWKDAEFAGHHGCVLEFLVDRDKKELIEFLLQEGLDTDRAGDPVLELARRRGAGKEVLDLIRKYGG